MGEGFFEEGSVSIILKLIKLIKKQSGKKLKELPISTRRVLELRGTTDISEVAWYKQIGASSSNMSLYKSGSRKFTIDQLIEVAKMYNTTLDYLCGLTDIKTKPGQKLTAVEMIEEGLALLKKQQENGTKGAIPKKLPAVTKKG